MPTMPTISKILHFQQLLMVMVWWGDHAHHHAHHAQRIERNLFDLKNRAVVLSPLLFLRETLEPIG